MDNDRIEVLICLSELYYDCDFIDDKEVKHNIVSSLDSLREHFQITDKEIKEVQQYL